MADPKTNDDIERIRQAGNTQENGAQPTRPGSPPMDDDERMRRSAESGEGEVPDEDPEREELEDALPSNRSQKRGGP